MLKLTGRLTSINVRKVVWTLCELAEPFELIDPTKDPQAARSLVSFNPIALTPVLQDGDRYLAGKFDRTDLLPQDPEQRSEVEKWMDWQATNLNSAWVTCFMALVRRDPAFVRNAEAVQESARRWNALNLLLDAHLANTEYLALDRFTLADVVIGLSVHRWRETPMQRPPAPHLDRYIAQLKRRSAMLAALERGEP
ncbi:MAG: glutathione S-transferase [Pseudomonadota bacterium]|nr:glutathione S-transferase [Pseudomonadota bacterium]